MVPESIGFQVYMIRLWPDNNQIPAVIEFKDEKIKKTEKMSGKGSRGRVQGCEGRR